MGKLTPRQLRPINYEPEDAAYLPGEDTKARKVINLLSRPDGATLGEIQRLLANMGRNNPNARHDPTYARTWMAESYMKAQYGFGIKSEREGDTLRFHLVYPKTVYEADGSKTKAPAKAKQAKARKKAA